MISAPTLAHTAEWWTIASSTVSLREHQPEYQGTSTAKSSIGQSSAEMADSPGDWLLQPTPNPCNHHGPETAVRLQLFRLLSHSQHGRNNLITCTK